MARSAGSMRLARSLAFAAPALVAWAIAVVLGTVHGWWRTPIAAPGDGQAFLEAVASQVARSTAGSCVVVLIEQGRAHPAYVHGIDSSVGTDTRFQMASISKWVTAWGVLKLVEQGRIDLDAPVDRHLERWHLPPGSSSNDGVTVRRLLAHAAGLGDGLGFQGYPPDRPLPSLVGELDQVGDPMPGRNGRVRVDFAPGETWRYSGGGYLVLQLLVEDVTRESFAAYMQREVDAAAVPPDRLAVSYDTQRRPVTQARFVAVAAASLYASAEDVTRFALAHATGAAGEPRGRGVLRPSTLDAMAAPTSYLWGVRALPIWGLGVRLHARGPAGQRVIGHDGQNHPALHHAVRIDPATGDGIVVLGSGDPELASRLAEAWLYWHAGTSDVDALRFGLGRACVAIAFGGAAIALAAIAIEWSRATRRRG